MKPIVRNALIALAALVLLGLAGWGLSKLLSGGSDAPRKPPKITLVPTTPPPPPPPPKEEKKPEPPKPQNEPKPEMAPPKEAPPAPPSQDLKMEGPAGNGPSAFSAGRISNEDLSQIGKGGATAGGGLFNPFTNYANLMKGELQRLLGRNRELRQRMYQVEVLLWVGRDGRVTRHQLARGTGDAEFDALLDQAFQAAPSFSTPPPDQMPQPIRLRVATGR